MLLLLVALSYGSLDVALRYVLTTGPTSTAVALLKAILQALAFVPPYLCRDRNASRSSTPLGPLALKLAFWLVVSQLALLAGLARTSAAQAAFLLQLSVVFTPLLEFLVLRRAQSRNVWLGALVALAGCAVLSLGGGATNDDAASGALAGNLIVVLAALTWAWYLVLTSAVPSDVDATEIQALKCFLATAGYFVCWAAGAFMAPGGLDVEALTRGWGALAPWLLVLYCAVVPGALADVLQQQAQVAVRAAEASLLLASEPVWAALLGLPFLGEAVSNGVLLGGLLIFLGAALAVTAPPLRVSITTSTTDLAHLAGLSDSESAATDAGAGRVC